MPIFSKLKQIQKLIYNSQVPILVNSAKTDANEVSFLCIFPYTKHTQTIQVSTHQDRDNSDP